MYWSQASIIVSAIAFICASFAKADIHEFGKTFKNEIQEKEYLGSLCKTYEWSTDPIKSYSQQVCADPYFDILKWEAPARTVFGYEDPYLTELNDYDIVNPLEIPELKNYKVIVVVNKSNNSHWGPAQRVLVFARNGAIPHLSSKHTQHGLLYYWKTSTGIPKYETPVGFYNIQGFSPNHQASKYKNVDMYWSLFFNDGIAIHSFNEFEMPRAIYNLGSKASHGCVRLDSYRAQRLYHLVGQVGESQVPLFENGKYTGHTGKEYSTLVLVTDRKFNIYKAISKMNLR